MGNIPLMVMRNMKLSDSALSLYLELFLFWFVAQKSHKWTYDGPNIEEEEDGDNDDNSDDLVKKKDSSRWKRMTKQMKLKIFHIFEEEDASLFPGYHWKYLLDYDSLSIWLKSGRVGGFGELKVDWSHDRFDQFLSNPLNQTEQRYLPTLKYFVNKGGQLLGLLRDFIQNTTQLSHAFLLCRVADNIYNDQSAKKTDEQSSDDPINNEWIVQSSRILKVKIFSFLLDYDHHSLGHISALNASQHSYMISLKQILKNYYRSGYSLY